MSDTEEEVIPFEPFEGSPYVLVMHNEDGDLEMRAAPGLSDLDTLRYLTEATANLARHL